MHRKRSEAALGSRMLVHAQGRPGEYTRERPCILVDLAVRVPSAVREALGMERPFPCYPWTARPDIEVTWMTPAEWFIPQRCCAWFGERYRISKIPSVGIMRRLSMSP